MSADSVNDDRMADYLDDLDAALEIYQVALKAALPVAALARPRRMDMSAGDCWREARRRGLVTDLELAWHIATERKHPASWIGYLLH